MRNHDEEALKRLEHQVNEIGRATRGLGLHLVDSQRTERIQAEDPPKVWKETPGIFRTWLSFGVFASACAIVGYCLMSVAIAVYDLVNS